MCLSLERRKKVLSSSGDCFLTQKRSMACHSSKMKYSTSPVDMKLQFGQVDQSNELDMKLFRRAHHPVEVRQQLR